jgi:peptidoglycan/LPS O-acetylase OafA/YrhL
MINSLQSLRFIFALMIFMHHFMQSRESIFLSFGSCGVTFFIILSGFVMALGYHDKIVDGKFSYSQYLTKRIFRLWPLHLLCLFIWLLWNLNDLTGLSLLKLIPNVLMSQSWFPISSIYYSGNQVSWCLSDLMFFYSVYPLLEHLSRSSSKVSTIALTFAFVCYIFVLALIPYNYEEAFIKISPLFRLFDFCLGIILFHLYKFISAKYSLIINRFSKTWKTIIECIVILFIIFSIHLSTSVKLTFSYASFWWLPMSTILIIFALFNNRGGYFHKY